MDNIFDASRHAVALLVTGDAELWKIIGLSFVVSAEAVALATPLALVLAYALAFLTIPGRRVLIALLRTWIALPAVMVGVLLYLLLSHSGPLGNLDILFTRTAMVIGQMALALPVVAAIAHAVLSGADRAAWETAITLGAGPWRTMWTVMREVRFGLTAAVVVAFGRVVAEVGCSLVVGGNILHHTRDIANSIALEASRGAFAQCIALGVVLLVLALLVNLTVGSLRSSTKAG